MERAYEKTLGTALVAIGLAVLLFGFYQAYNYTQNLPTKNYQIFQIGGSGGNGGNGGNINGTFNGVFVATFSFLLVEYLVGASILKAGWNLVTPKAETIQVRVKPRSLQVEPVGYSVPPAASPASPSMPTTPVDTAPAASSMGPTPPPGVT